ncbi:hypothetical protein DV738_g3525, partial [Chaetothyriales sp. CBS 135597]
MAAPHKSVLILPSLSNPPAPSALSSAYAPTLTSLLPKLLPGNTKASARLDIGLVLDPSYHTSQPRTQLFSPLESLLRELYSLVCLVAAKQGIDLDLPGGLDVRVFFVHPPSDSTNAVPTPLSGPLVDLSTLAASLDSATAVYVPGSEAGLSLATTFSAAFEQVHDTKPRVTVVSHGPSTAASAGATTTTGAAGTSTTTTHKAVAVGGTFDHLHIGHKLLLTATLLPASPQPAHPPRTITVGITDQDLLVNKKHASVLEPWAQRVERTAAFVESILYFGPAADVPRIRRIDELHNPGVNGRITRYTYTPLPPTTSAALARQSSDESSVIINYTLITDPFGPTITDQHITAIVVSTETRAGGAAVNDKRVDKGWEPLEVFEVGVLDAAGSSNSSSGTAAAAAFADKISSTQIRQRLVELASEGKL